MDLIAGEPGGPALTAPQAVLDAGGESASILMAAIARRIEDLDPGQLLEVVSRADHARIDVLAWCYVMGHELLCLLADGDRVRFWIRKRQL